MPRPAPHLSVFPYTTLFRSLLPRRAQPAVVGGVPVRRRHRDERADRHRHPGDELPRRSQLPPVGDRKSTRLNSSHVAISYAVFCLKKKIKTLAEARLCITYT